MRPAFPALLAAALVTLIFRSALAGPNADARFALHIVEAVDSDPCFDSRPIPSCAFVQTTAYPPAGAPVYVYVLLYGDATAGMGGARFGIDYFLAPPGSFQVLDWTLCADGQVAFNGWPSAQSGLEVAWNPANCQRRMSGTGDPVWDRASAVVGYFYCTSYGPAQMGVIPHPQDGKATITDCAGSVDDVANAIPSQLGVAGFGTGGYSPCSVLDIYPCSITGPSEMAAGSIHQFSAYAYGDHLHWSVEGNGELVGPIDQPSVEVRATGPGTLTLYHNQSTLHGIPGYACGKIVDVLDATPVRVTSWSAIKALYR
jgi:hypothetical protein